MAASIALPAEGSSPVMASTWPATSGAMASPVVRYSAAVAQLVMTGATSQGRGRASAVPREVIDGFLHGPSWAKFDPELGYILGNYRLLYARTLAAGVNHFSQAQIVLNLLSTGRETDPAHREEEGALIAAALRALPPNRAWRVLQTLRVRPRPIPQLPLRLRRYPGNVFFCFYPRCLGISEPD